MTEEGEGIPEYPWASDPVDHCAECGELIDKGVNDYDWALRGVACPRCLRLGFCKTHSGDYPDFVCGECSREQETLRGLLYERNSKT